jgi:hypothetical protein
MTPTASSPAGPILAPVTAGALVIFGWEKALGPDPERHWWCERAIEGASWLVTSPAIADSTTVATHERSWS